MLTILSGTNRPGSYTRRVVRHVEAAYRDLGQIPTVIDLLELPPEAFLPAAYAEKPPTLAPFIERVLRASGLVVVTPEYNGGPPGVLKYFIDMLPFPESLQRRPVCFIGLGAGEWGALRPVEQLQAIFGYRYAFLYPERVFIRNCEDAIAEDGRFLDPDLDRRLRRQAEGFLRYVDQLKSLAPPSA
jgi:chromate reductase